MCKDIVIVTSELPFPDNSGGKIYTWGRMKILKKMGYNITLFSSCEKDENVDLYTLKKVCKEVYTYEKKHKMLRALRYGYYPFTVATRRSNKMIKDINKYIEENQIKLVIADSAIIASNVKSVSIPIIITQHNIEYMAFKSMSINAKNLKKKIAYYREYLLCKMYEKRLYKNKYIKGYTFISDKDMSFFQEKYPDANCILIPMGWSDDGSKDVISNTNSKKIIYTGQMNYEPNAQAVIHFAENIFGTIRKKIPDAEFYIVGKNPTEPVKELEKIEGVTVTGYVDSIEKYMQDCGLVVIPLLSGGGVKIKLFEALSYKKVVVSTDKGYEGTVFKNKQDLFVENDSDKFAEKCIEVLSDGDKYKQIGENGYNTLKEIYSWNKIGQRYSKFIEDIIK